MIKITGKPFELPARATVYDDMVTFTIDKESGSLLTRLSIAQNISKMYLIRKMVEHCLENGSINKDESRDEGKEENTEMVSLRITKSSRTRLDTLSASLKKSRSVLLRSMIDFCLEPHRYTPERRERTA